MSKKTDLQGIDKLFGGAEAEKATREEEVKPETEAPIHVKKQTSKHVKAPDREKKLKKYSLYFEAETLAELDEVWFELKRELADEKVSKWRIVSVILEDAFKDRKRIKRLIKEAQEEK